MYLLYADESNLDPSTTEFFVYGGVTIPGDRAAELSKRIDGARKRLGVPKNEIVKFNPPPASLGHSQFIDLKVAIIEAAVNCECSLLANLIMHKIATNPQEARLYAINTIVYHFECFLEPLGEHGLVLIDRFQDDRIDDQLRERFSVGVTNLPHSSEYPLERIIGYHYAAIGQAHFTSVVDIVIGSLRYAVNCFSSGNNLDSARRILATLGPLFFRRNGEARVPSIGLQLNPVVVKSPMYRQRYAELKDFLHGAGIEMEQEITGVRP